MRSNFLSSHRQLALALTAIIGTVFASVAWTEETPSLTIDGWLRATPPGARNAAAFMTLSNRSTTELILTGVQCHSTLAARCELHEHLQVDGRMRMQKVTAPLTIPAGGSLRFAPGGYHVMLLDIAQPLIPGTRAELVFTFADQSTYHAQLPVKPVSEE